MKLSYEEFLEIKEEFTEIVKMGILKAIEGKDTREISWFCSNCDKYCSPDMGS